MTDNPNSKQLPQSLRVLVADDHYLFRSIIEGAFEQRGIAVDSANNGAMALEFIRKSIEEKKPYNIVFLDWNMPGADGYALLKVLRVEALYDHSPIFMVTAETQREDVMKALKAGITSYIFKPISRENIEAHIDRSLDLLRTGFVVAKHQ